jgi:sugar/nucleoside kinase (ribokinase family)
VDGASGDHIIFSNQEANEKLQVDPRKLSGADFVSVTDLSGDWESIVEKVQDFCLSNKIRIAYNPRGINIKRNPRKVFGFAGKSEIFFVNKDEAIEIIVAQNGKLETQSEEHLLKQLKGSGVKIAVMTDGPGRMTEKT